MAQRRGKRGQYNHRGNKKPNNSRDKIKYSNFVNNFRKLQSQNGGVTEYKHHKRSCKGIRWEANEIIDDFLWLGSIKSAKNIGMLYELEIGYILNCADENYIKYEKSMFKTCCLNAKDKNGYNILKYHLADAIKFIDEARENNKKILIHCIGGVNRSATIVIAYLLYLQIQRDKQANLMDVTKLVLEKRPFALTNTSFQYQLLDHQYSLNKQLDKDEKQKIKKNRKMKNRKGKREYGYSHYDNDQDNDDQKT